MDQADLHELYTESKKEALTWKEDYPEFERLADNDIIDDLDENLPEVNDGSLAAALFKLPKRIVNSDLSGRAKALDRDDAWLTELANMQWENEIIPNANTQAPFHRKWKDAVRKAAIYGSVPVITIFTERGNYTGADFLVAQPQDVTLEAGKVSDYDSDVIFWDVYFTKSQMLHMIEQAKTETKEAKESGDQAYNKWNVKALTDILKGKQTEDRDSRDVPNQKDGKDVTRGGFKFCVAFQRGVDAEFYMYHPATKQTVREWTNPDPTGDLPVHFLYCYQDFINPYGIGIVKLAGGSQNVLDYYRQADVLATQLGLEPPVQLTGNIDQADIESMVYERRALWMLGQNVQAEQVQVSNAVYQALPDRINMVKSSLNNLLPMGDTSVSAGAGDPLQSKTPAGVKLAQANLSIDDDDFKDNLYMTYAAVAKSMINTHFANMQGSDLMKLTDDERDILMKAGLEFPVDEEGKPGNELEVIWDEARATFDFEIDPEENKTTDEAQQLEGLTAAANFIKDPATLQLLQMGGEVRMGTKKIDLGELLGTIISLSTENDKIIQDIDPEELEQEALAAEQAAVEQEALAPEAPVEGELGDQDLVANLEAVMNEYGVDEQTAAAALDAEAMGTPPEVVMEALSQWRQQA